MYPTNQRSRGIREGFTIRFTIPYEFPKFVTNIGHGRENRKPPPQVDVAHFGFSKIEKTAGVGKAGKKARQEGDPIGHGYLETVRLDLLKVSFEFSLASVPEAGRNSGRESCCCSRCCLRRIVLTRGPIKG